MSRDTCQEGFSPDKWEDKIGIEPIREGPKPCNRKALPNADACQYHCSSDKLSKTEEEVFTELLEELHSGTEIIAPKFDSLNITDEDIPDYVDEIEIYNLVVRNSLNLNCSNRSISFKDIELGRSGQEDSVIRIRDSKNVVFVNGVFHTPLDIEIITKDCPTVLSNDGGVQISNCKFYSSARLGFRTDYEVEITNCDYQGGVLIDNSIFSREVTLENQTFYGGLVLRNSHIRDDFYLNNVSLLSPLIIDSSGFASIKLRPRPNSKDGPCTLIMVHNSSLEKGHIEAEERVYYNFTESAIGDVSLDSSGKDKNFRFFKSSFDGFRFRPNRDYFEENDWEMHSIPDPVTEDYGEKAIVNIRGKEDVSKHLQPAELANSASLYYNAAKTAEANGESYVEDQFLLKEMKAKKQRIVNEKQAEYVETRVSIWREWKLRLLGLTSNYGVSTRYILSLYVSLLLASLVIAQFSTLAFNLYLSILAPLFSALIVFTLTRHTR